jgi:hypothetical protein
VKHKSEDDKALVKAVATMLAHVMILREVAQEHGTTVDQLCADMLAPDGPRHIEQILRERMAAAKKG